ncbi:hypothetical protein I3J27_28385 [Bradyrhizobium xenonodulans]|uniref:CopG family transcriptional regulator n=1 Tax=Bradyrhizobium xenonodulans TaxID=2736875 RepID=A0ABY7MET1_9BRAD|nr:hypothetical protein [Bradyrhizobium xenonodulans]WBL76913.1 hypothetical protein I3J27_28385 [Bradyrhizobium xenonodulans]
MKITVHIPDDIVAEVKDQLPPPEMGVLEAIALDAILGFIDRLKSPPSGGTDA